MRDHPALHFAEPVPAGTQGTISVTTTGMDCPINVRVLTDISAPADHIMHVLWAAVGLVPHTSALLCRHGEGIDTEYLGVAASWAHSANRDMVTDLATMQFAQLFLPHSEVYAQIDPAQGWRARLSLGPAHHMGDDAEGEAGSSVQVSVDPFGIPTTHTAAEIDVLLKASDGERLTPVEQQILVRVATPMELPLAEICQAMALATLHGIRLGLAPEAAHLLPQAMMQFPASFAYRELVTYFLDPDAHSAPVMTTKQGRLTVQSLRHLLTQAPYLIMPLGADEMTLPDITTITHDDVPLLDSAWQAALGSGLLTTHGQQVQVVEEFSWLSGATLEERQTAAEMLFLRWVLAEGHIDGVGPDGTEHHAVHPTVEFETAQDYADSLISEAAAAPELAFQRLLDEAGVEWFDEDTEYEHLEFTMELRGTAEPVTRRMSIPAEANLHAAVETMLLMFEWE